MKTYVFGDIHGCRTALVELLGKIDPDPSVDTLVFLGDYVDRGPDSKGVIDEILRLRTIFRRTITLKGNHEEVFLRYLAGYDREFFLSIGGVQTLASYGIIDSRHATTPDLVPPEHLDFLRNLLPYWEDEKNIYVHAGLQPGVHLTQQTSHWLFWGGGYRLNEQEYDSNKRVIFGHVAQPKPIVGKHSIAIDCGAVYGGQLTCLILPDEEFVSVRSDKYWPAA